MQTEGAQYITHDQHQRHPKDRPATISGTARNTTENKQENSARQQHMYVHNLWSLLYAPKPHPFQPRLTTSHPISVTTTNNGDLHPSYRILGSKLKWGVNQLLAKHDGSRCSVCKFPIKQNWKNSQTNSLQSPPSARSMTS